MALSTGKKNLAQRPVEGGQHLSALLEQVLRQVVTLPAQRQDAIAAKILDDLQQEETDPETARFQHLVEAKYTRGLSAKETAEMKRLEVSIQKGDEAFYQPILERATAALKRKRLAQ